MAEWGCVRPEIIEDHVNYIRRRAPGIRNRAFFVLDLVLLPACALLAFGARYEGMWTPDVERQLVAFLLTAFPLKLILLLGIGMYRRLWRYASVADLEMLMLAAAACGVVDLVSGGVLVTALQLVPARPSFGAV